MAQTDEFEKVNPAEPVIVETGNATISVRTETKEILIELRSIYMLKTWDSAVLFLIDNMKKIPRPKSKYFD